LSSSRRFGKDSMGIVKFHPEREVFFVHVDAR
jgi:hypothetical protein